MIIESVKFYDKELYENCHDIIVMEDDAFETEVAAPKVLEILKVVTAANDYNSLDVKSEVRVLCFKSEYQKENAIKRTRRCYISLWDEDACPRCFRKERVVKNACMFCEICACCIYSPIVKNETE